MSGASISASSPAVSAGASRQLLRGAYSLLANTAVTTMLGLGFWVAAARLYPSATVGRDTVLIAVMIELSTVCRLNLDNGITRFLPDLGADSAKALGGAYSLTAAVGVLAGIAFVLAAPSLSGELAYLRADPALGVGFVAALALWGVFTLQDTALTATHRAPWIPVENAVFGVLKLAGLPLLVVCGVANGVFVAWALPIALLAIPVNVLLFTRVLPRRARPGVARSSLERMGRRRAARFLAQDYLASVFTQATMTILPLMVIGILGASSSAYFAIPFTIAVAFDTFAYSACTALVVEATRVHEDLRELTALFARRVIVPLVPLALLGVLAAPLLMLPFGSTYASHGTTVLRLLLLASILRMAIALYAAVSRAQARALRIAVVEFALLVLALGATAALAPHHGIEGVAIAWFAANAVVCVGVLVGLLAFARER